MRKIKEKNKKKLIIMSRQIFGKKKKKNLKLMSKRNRTHRLMHIGNLLTNFNHKYQRIRRRITTKNSL